MKPFLAIWAFLLLPVFSNGSPIHDGIFHTPGLSIVDYKTAQLDNPHRPAGLLQLSFEGVNITRVSNDFPASWSLEMFGDRNNSVHIRSQSDALNETTQFTFLWSRITKNTSLPEICLHMGANNASWFSTYLEEDQPWPYNTGKPYSKLRPLRTGSYNSPDASFGPVVENFFFNTDGFAVYFNSYFGVYLRRQAGGRLCMTTSSFLEDHRKSFASLSLTLYMAGNIAAIHQATINHYRTLGRPQPNWPLPDGQMFKQTSLQLDTAGLNQSSLLQTAQNLAKRGLPSLQLVLLNWEAHQGDLTFDPVRFSDPKSLISSLHRLGCLVKLAVSTFVSAQSATFKSHPTLLLNSSHKPFIFNWTQKDGQSTTEGVLFDLRRYQAEIWITKALEKLQKDCGVDSFQFTDGELGTFDTFGTANHLKTDLYWGEQLSNAFSYNFVFIFKRFTPLATFDSAHNDQRWSPFLRPRNIQPTWASLRSIIPTVLTLSLANYPLILAPTFTSSVPFTEDVSLELYTRWLQLATFFPALQLPSSFSNQSDASAVFNLTAKWLALHAEHFQMINSTAAQAISEGRPLLRPLWYLSPDDRHTYVIDDQYALGSDLIVAPVLSARQTERSVYLPVGTWIDGNGAKYTGPGRFNVLAPIEELPYFKRQMV